MMKISAPVLLLLLGLPLAGCGDTARTFGLTRDAPDEFQVTTRAPLSMPPMLGDLPTPRPGASRPQELSAREQAEAALVPGSFSAAPRASGQSSGERSFLAQTGGAAQPDIRNRVDEETMRLDRTDRSVVDRVLFWRPQPEPGIPVDATREAQRIRENAALGRQMTEGVTPVIQPRRATWFESLKFW